MRKTKYKFLGRFGDRYIWQSIHRLPNDSRVEEISCNVSWFWSKQ